MFKVSNNNRRIKCKICSKLTIEAAVILVSLLLTLNINDTFLVCFFFFFCFVFFFFFFLFCFVLFFAAFEHVLLDGILTVSSFFLFFCHKEVHLRCCIELELSNVMKILKGVRGTPHDPVQPWENMSNSFS